MCSCGSSLSLGAYQITLIDDDFTFKGEFFCPVCNKGYKSEKSGIRGIIEKWVKGLKKIEIKATGVGIERQ